MATRYTGTLKLTITYRAKTDDYSVRIQDTQDNTPIETQSGIRLSPHDRQHHGRFGLRLRPHRQRGDQLRG